MLFAVLALLILDLQRERVAGDEAALTLALGAPRAAAGAVDGPEAQGGYGAIGTGYRQAEQPGYLQALQAV